MKIMTLGAGFVAEHLPYEQIKGQEGMWHESPYRLTPNEEDIDWCLHKDHPNVIINCIGRTGRPNVDWCENNRAETYMANVVLPLMMADWCGKNDVHMIHLGSGCVYYGESPNKMTMSELADDSVPFDVDTGWKETDFAHPQSYYSKTKYATDLMLGEMPHVTTLRLRMPVSDKDNPRNLINKLRGYKQVIDIPNSMTFMDDLVRCIDWAAKNRPGGIFHVANTQPLTAARIMREYRRHVHGHRFEIINEAQLDKLVIAKRSNCILNTDKLRNAGFQMMDSEAALMRCMDRYVKNTKGL